MHALNDQGEKEPNEGKMSVAASQFALLSLIWPPTHIRHRTSQAIFIPFVSFEELSGLMMTHNLGRVLHDQKLHSENIVK